MFYRWKFVNTVVHVQTSDSSWVTPNVAAPVPRFSTVPLPAAPRAPFPDPRQTSSAPLPPPPGSSAVPPAPTAGQPPPSTARFGAPPATARSSTVDGTETITVTNVVSAPAINKLGSLFNSLNKTVTGALNTFITQQHPHPQSPGPWQPVGQQFDHQHLQQAAPVQQFPIAPLLQAAPVVPATAAVPRPAPPPLQAPQRPPVVAPRLPSDASSAFVRVRPAVDWQPRPGAPQHPSQLDYHHGAPPPSSSPPQLHNHVPQLPPASVYSTQSPHVGEMYRDGSRNHVDPRMHRAPAGRGKWFWTILNTREALTRGRTNHHTYTSVTTVWVAWWINGLGVGLAMKVVGAAPGRAGRGCPTTAGKSFTPMCPCHQAA